MRTMQPKIQEIPLEKAEIPWNSQFREIFKMPLATRSAHFFLDQMETALTDFAARECSAKVSLFPG